MTEVFSIDWLQDFLINNSCIDLLCKYTISVAKNKKNPSITYHELANEIQHFNQVRMESCGIDDKRSPSSFHPSVSVF